VNLRFEIWSSITTQALKGRRGAIIRTSASYHRYVASSYRRYVASSYRRYVSICRRGHAANDRYCMPPRCSISVDGLARNRYTPCWKIVQFPKVCASYPTRVAYVILYTMRCLFHASCRSHVPCTHKHVQCTHMYVVCTVHTHILMCTHAGGRLHRFEYRRRVVSQQQHNSSWSCTRPATVVAGDNHNNSENRHNRRETVDRSTSNG
jgi:hypothetical protein